MLQKSRKKKIIYFLLLQETVEEEGRSNCVTSPESGK
jgi:hypothetical protein